MASTYNRCCLRDGTTEEDVIRAKLGKNATGAKSVDELATDKHGKSTVEQRCEEIWEFSNKNAGARNQKYPQRHLL